MKKLLFGCLFVACAISVYSQDKPLESKNFKLGLTAHPNFGYIKSDVQNVKSNGLRAGFTYGLLGDFLFADNYSFSTGLLLSTINGQTEQSTTAMNSGNLQTVYKLQYIEIPLKIKLFTNQNNGMRFFGEFGLGNGINVRAKSDINNLSNNVSIKNQDINKDISKYRGSIIIGAGSEFNLSGKTNASVGLSFDNGFTSIRSMENGKLKNSYIGLNLSVFF